MSAKIRTNIPRLVGLSSKCANCKCDIVRVILHYFHHHLSSILEQITIFKTTKVEYSDDGSLSSFISILEGSVGTTFKFFCCCFECTT